MKFYSRTAAASGAPPALESVARKHSESHAIHMVYFKCPNGKQTTKKGGGHSVKAITVQFRESGATALHVRSRSNESKVLLLFTEKA